MGSVRKQEIYGICVEYGMQFNQPNGRDIKIHIDVIIVEDDPYFFLQEGPYIPKSHRVTPNRIPSDDEASYVSGLEPSYLK
jgi:aromatic amino acid aminotransferase I